MNEKVIEEIKTMTDDELYETLIKMYLILQVKDNTIKGMQEEINLYHNKALNYMSALQYACDTLKKNKVPYGEDMSEFIAKQPRHITGETYFWEMYFLDKAKGANNGQK